MARIICISKYPPLEGGIAAKTYWMCRALAERGHNIHVVTDPEDIGAEYCSPAFEEVSEEKNIHIHRPDQKTPWHIPNDTHRALALLNTALEVANEYGADVIDTGYLIPYGLVGCLASHVTGIPFLLRHGGSDLHKFVDKGIWSNLINTAFKTSSAIITDKEQFERFAGLKRAVSIAPYVPDPAFFRPISKEKNKPTLALIGKANYYWRHRGWHRAIEIIKILKGKFNYLIVSQGVGLEAFKKYVEEETNLPIEWRGFVNPAEMPRLLQSISGLFVLQDDLPFPVFSNLVMEALYCNVTIIIDRNDIVEHLENHGLHINADCKYILTIPNNDAKKAVESIAEYFEKNLSQQKDVSHRIYDYENYIRKTEEAVLSVIPPR